MHRDNEQESAKDSTTSDSGRTQDAWVEFWDLVARLAARRILKMQREEKLSAMNQSDDSQKRRSVNGR